MFNRKKIKQLTLQLEIIEKIIDEYLNEAHPFQYRGLFYSPSQTLNVVLARLKNEKKEQERKDQLVEDLKALGIAIPDLF